MALLTNIISGPIRKMLGGQKFASDTEVQSAVSQWLGLIVVLHQAFTSLLTDGINA